MIATDVKRKSRPRIGLDLHVVDGIFQGSRTHCLELFSRVIALTPECDFVIFANDKQPLLTFSQSFGLPHVHHVPMRHRSSPVRLIWQLPQLVRRHGVSLLHTQYIAPPLPFCATAVTVHDILFESHPQYFDRSFVLRSRLLVRSSVKRSALVFTVSEFSRNEIRMRYGISGEQIHAIPNGVDQIRFCPGTAGWEVPHALGLEHRKYFLTVGRLDPRKNHASLLQAWGMLPVPRPRLVLVGQRHRGTPDLFLQIRTLGLESDVLVLEAISDQELPALYRHARGFIYCSWAEGFGIPLLEAMVSGVPVVSSANTALAEVGSGAVLWAAADRPGHIAAAVAMLDRSEILRAQLITRGFERAKCFSWEKSAIVVRDAYLRYFGAGRLVANMRVE